MPITIGPTVSRWLGFAANSMATSAPDGLTYLPFMPRWYFTSPDPWTDDGSTWPSNSEKIAS